MSLKIMYFVHGTTFDNEKNLSSGWKDVALSPLGIKQSQELPWFLGDIHFDAVFCSDLDRALQSAKISFEGRFPIFIDARLRECNYGIYNGESSDIVEPLQEEKIFEPFPEGESYEMVKDRINDFLSDISHSYDGKHIAIVAHKAPQLALDVLIDKKSWEQAFQEDWRKTKAWKPGWNYDYKR